ncbi:MAG: 50S ribosomal protein L21 [Candidatus Margulisiibacteriota bacterium]
MFVVVEINDKQHLVEEGQIFTIDGNIESEKVSFDSILMVQNDSNIEYGQPYVKDASVELEVIESGKREKDIVFKFKRKTGYKLTRGHRQNSTLVRVSKISISGKKAAKTTKATTEKSTKTVTATEKKAAK